MKYKSEERKINSFNGNKIEVQYRVNNNGCHICTSHYEDKQGYPRMKRNGIKGKICCFYAKEKYGEIKKGQVVRHTCDIPQCINPNHLLLGTQKDNIKDMVQRDRHTRGERSWNVKITENDALKIISLKGKVIQKKLSKMFKLSKSSICRIQLGKRWKYLQ